MKPSTIEIFFRYIKNEPDAILAIDVMNYLPEYLRALLHHHIFKDIVICNSDEKALDLSKKHKLDVSISLGKNKTYKTLM